MQTSLEEEDERKFPVGKAAAAAGLAVGQLRNWLNRPAGEGGLREHLKQDTPENTWRRFSFREVLDLALTAELVGFDVSVAKAFQHSIWLWNELFGTVPSGGGEVDFDRFRFVLNKWEYGPNHTPGPHYNVDFLHADQLPEHEPYRFIVVKPRRILERVAGELFQ